MNTPNNKRKRESQEKIEKAFIQLLQTKEVNQISVTDICKITHLNRSTFYANYIDIYDLVDRIKDTMLKEFFDIYKEECENQQHSYDFLKLFIHIKDNQLFYKTYFKLNFDFTNDFKFLTNLEAEKFYDSSEFLEYRIEFFKAGINAIIKKWLYNGCKETPEEIVNIIKTEYEGKKLKI